MSTSCSLTKLGHAGASSEQSLTRVWAPEQCLWREAANRTAIRAVGSLSVVLNAMFGSRAGELLGGITYHRVAPRYPNVPVATQNVDPDRFREQLTGLLHRGFNFWPLSKALECRDQGVPVPPRTVFVTFDDGYGTIFDYAWPVLRELNLPATVFLATGYLDSQAPFPWDTWASRYRDRLPPQAYRPLTLAQCREMAADSRVEMGSHSTTHQDFRHRPDRVSQGRPRVRGVYPLSLRMPEGAVRLLLRQSLQGVCRRRIGGRGEGNGRHVRTDDGVEPLRSAQRSFQLGPL